MLVQPIATSKGSVVTSMALCVCVCACAGGWFHTGDQGFLDEQGYVTLTGRLKELINRGGEKVSPLEVSKQECEGARKCHP